MGQILVYQIVPAHLTEVRFAIFFSGGFITAIVGNPPERRLAKCTTVHLLGKRVIDLPGSSGSFVFLTDGKEQ